MLKNEAVPSLVVSFYSQSNNNIFILNFARNEAIASLTFSQSTIFISESKCLNNYTILFLNLHCVEISVLVFLIAEYHFRAEKFTQ